MSTDTTQDIAVQQPEGGPIDLRLEVVALPVSDVDRAKKFYAETLGWRLDADFDVNPDYRVVQVTPPGSPCSVHFGRGITAAAPGSAEHMYLVVSDIVAARGDLAGRGIDVGEVTHALPGQDPQPGREPEGGSYQSFATFQDPDGNTWLLQEITTRLPGR